MEDKLINLDKLRAEYKQNEAINAHTENCLMLVNAFGSEEHKRRMGEIAAKHRQLGYMPYDLKIERDEMVRGYYAIMINRV